MVHKNKTFGDKVGEFVMNDPLLKPFQAEKDPEEEAKEESASPVDKVGVDD